MARVVPVLVAFLLAVPLAVASVPDDAGLGRDAANAISEADPVTLAAPHDGHVGEPDDLADWFLIDIPSGKSLRLTILRDDRSPPCVKVLDAALAVRIDNNGWNGCLSYTDPTQYFALGSGTFYLKIYADPATDYTFQVDAIELPDLAATLTATPGLLPHEVLLTATVRNVGSVPVSYYAYLKNDGYAFLGTVSSAFWYPSCGIGGDLAPGEALEFRATASIVGANGFNLNAYVDSIPDANPADNSAKAYYTVGTSAVREQLQWGCA